MSSRAPGSRDQIQANQQTAVVPGQQQRQTGARRALAAVTPPAQSRRPDLLSFGELLIPDTLREAVEKELTPGEEILWLGRPSRNPLVQPPKTIFSYIGLGLIGFAGFLALLGVVRFAPLLIFAAGAGLFGLIFYFIGRVDPTKSCRSCYVVTNRRAILVELAMRIGSVGVRTTSYLPENLVGLERVDHHTVAGAGDLILEYDFALPGQSFDWKSGTVRNQTAGFGRSDVAQRVARGFFFLDHAREVERLIRTELLGQEDNPQDNPQAALAPAADAGAAAVVCREDGTISAELKAKVLGNLDASEKVVWLGQPSAKLVALRSLGYVVAAAFPALIALIWFAVVLLSAKAPTGPTPKNAAAAQSQGISFSSLIAPGGLMLVSLGLASVPLLRGYFAGRSCYALTTRRALVYRAGLFGPTRESYPPQEVAAMRHSDAWLEAGSGDLIFRSVLVLRRAGSINGLTIPGWKTTNYGFLALPRVKEVEHIVQETLIDPYVDRFHRAR
jgi:hypothetical protein